MVQIVKDDGKDSKRESLSWPEAFVCAVVVSVMGWVVVQAIIAMKG